MNYFTKNITQTAMIGLAVVALILAYFGCNEHIREDEELSTPRVESDIVKEAVSDHALITKLIFIREELLTWVIRPGFCDEMNGNTFHYHDNLGHANRAGVKVGQTFFDEGPAAGRFKLLGHRDQEVVNNRVGKNEIRTFARIEDQRPHKAGILYEIPAPLAPAFFQDHRHFDRTAVFILDSLNFGDAEFKVEEFATFTLPPGSDGHTYKLASVNEKEVSIEFMDAEGQKHSVTVPQGGTVK